MGTQDCKVEKCMACPSRHLGLMAELQGGELDCIDQTKHVTIFPKGAQIFRAGDTPKGLYCISTGTVKIEKTSVHGKSHILRMVGPGGYLGYRALFAKEPYEADAIAHDEANVCLIPKAAFEEVIKRNPEFALKLMSKFCKEIRESEERMISATDKEAGQRVAEALLFIDENFSDRQWTRKDIAEWAGTTPETVMRSISDFTKKGWVVTEGRRTQVLNKQALLSKAEIFI